MEEIKIDGIPVQDYGTPNSRTTYSKQLKTYTNKEDLKAMKDKTFETYRKKLDKMCEEYAKQLLFEERKIIWDNSIRDFIQRPKEMEDFIKEIVKIEEKYKLTISSAGFDGFEITKFNEKDVQELYNASKNY